MPAENGARAPHKLPKENRAEKRMTDPICQGWTPSSQDL